MDASFLVSHELLLAKAPDAHKHFDNRDKGWTKVMLKPAAAQAKKSRKASAAKR